MTKRDDGGHAYPVRGESSGMSLRDWFAGQAMAGLLAGLGSSRLKDLDPPGPRHWATWSYNVADAMLISRKEGEAGGGDV